VPNSFTGLSLLLGLGSVVMSAQGDFTLAAWLILWGCLLDKLDGSAARLLNATSKFGVEFDSFADFVAFGIAPAGLLYYRLIATGHFVGWQKTAVMIVAGMYALALAVRLARFNITTGGESVFFGLPGTLLGAIIASGFLTWEKFKLSEGILLYSPAVLVLGAVLMVSTVRLPKLKLRKNKLVNAFTACNVIGVYIFAPLRILPEYMLTLAVGYTVGGVIYCLANPSFAAEAAEPDSSPVPNAGEAETAERLA
jgi:CDP-diacylglycerol---serine O-phosphatidyltransferase